MKAIATRIKALQILNQVDSAQAHSSALLKAASRDPKLHFGLLQRLVKGTLQWKSRLDAALDSSPMLASRDISPELRNILRMAAYQVLFMERVRKDLVLSESLELAKRFARELAARNVREIISGLEKKQLKKLSPSSSTAEIAEICSHPQWLVERWIRQFGRDEAIAMCEANNRPWPVCVRVNSLRSSPNDLAKVFRAERVKVERGEFLPECYRILALPAGRRLDRLESFRKGLFQVQDESSALVAKLLDPRPGESIVDLCAAPGGKASHCAMLMRNQGNILAIDIHAAKIRFIQENAKRLGLSIIQTRVGDALTIQLKRKADRVLLDAPCSGLGVLGRKSDLRWAKDAETLVELSELQLRLLSHAAELVKPGGRLVYSTCTVEPDENEAIIDAFLGSHLGWKVVDAADFVDQALTTKDGYVRTWPHRHGMGGAFAAALRAPNS